MLSTTVRVGVVAAMATLAVGVSAAPALACGQSGNCGDQGPRAPESTGHTIVVSVSGSYVRGGSGGSSGGSTSVSVPSPCWYTQGYSGKEYARWVTSGEAQRMWHHTGGDVDGPYVPYPGYQAHADDDQGHWYGGQCSSATFGDDLDSFFSYSEQWFADHKTVWVDANEQPPVPPIPPELLLYAAQQAMQVPEPAFDWNPHVQGASSLVNLPTWFWSTAPDIEGGNVVASAGGHSAEVSVDLSGVTYSSVHAGSVACPGGGTAWVPGAQSDCTLSFPQATPAETVTATADWSGSWRYDGAPQGAVTIAPTSVSHDFPVIEVQAPVVDIG